MQTVPDPDSTTKKHDEVFKILLATFVISLLAKKNAYFMFVNLCSLLQQMTQIVPLQY